MLNEKKVAEHFFCSASQGLNCKNVAVIVVTHIVPGIAAFIHALADIVRLAAIVPKPNSIHQPTLLEVNRRYTVIHFTRRDCSNEALITAKIEELIRSDEKLVILDMGGYFAKSLIYWNF